MHLDFSSHNWMGCNLVGSSQGKSTLDHDVLSGPILYPLPLVDEFLNHLLGTEIQINLRRCEVVVAQEPLQRWQ